MSKTDDWNTIAKKIKEQLDKEKLAFKTFSRKDIENLIGEANENNHKGDFPSLEQALMRVGFTMFPELKTEGEGYTRIFRAGSLIASLLNAITAPGEKSDEELSNLIGQIKKNRNVLKPVIG
jgi:hypothetical protein